MKKKIYKIGLVHGVFDFIHIGHIEHFREAKKHCQKLIASVTADKFVNKGPNRPAFNIKERVNFLKSLIYIDEVLISNFETATKSINKIKPDVYFKGLDYDKIDKKQNNNLNKEIKELHKFGGKFLITKTKLRSSSKILNENFNFIKPDTKKFLKSINKKELLDNLKKNLFTKKKPNKKILLSGEQILDYYTNVSLQGKSQKSSVISAVKKKTSRYGGGTILVANLLSEFMDNLNYFVHGNQEIKKYLYNYLTNKNINLIMSDDKVKKFLIKERFIESYSKARLFQLNQNQEFYNFKRKNQKYQKRLLREMKKFKNILIFDFGYGYIDDAFTDNIKNKKNKFYINCQTNSSNYGFNLFSKYKKAEILCVDEAEFRLTIKNKNDDIKELIKANNKSLKNYKIFIVTCGSKGCFVLKNKIVEFIPTVYETTLDTTGCGDIFFSTFVYFYIQEQFSIREISLLSHIAAGLHGLSEGNKNVVNKNYFFQSAQTILK
jgi:cytidyltransferase-like protein